MPEIRASCSDVDNQVLRERKGGRERERDREREGERGRQRAERGEMKRGDRRQYQAGSLCNEKCIITKHLLN